MEKSKDYSDVLRKSFFHYCQKVIEAAKKHPKFKFGKNNHSILTKSGKDAMRISNYMNKIESLVKDLEKTHTFIKRFPSKKYYESNDINQLDFIKYHYEVFLHKVHTILEVKKLWINEFYKVGLKEKDCKWNNLKSVKKIQESPIFDIITSYHDSFKGIIQFRHLNTHRAFYNDGKNDELQSELFMSQSMNDFELEDKEEYFSRFPKFLTDYKIREYRKEKLVYVKSGIEAANIYSTLFIDTMISEFFNKVVKEKKMKTE